jgi:hypothetical protein
MTGGDVPSPPARRVRRPGWRDPRVGVGVVLVAGSVALGTWVVGSATRGDAYYAAADTLTPGDPLDATRVRVVDARLGEAGSAYLRADAALPDGAVLTRVVGSGELVPAAALAGAADVGLRPVGVPITGPLPSSVVAGASVDLWLTEPPAAVVGGESTPARATPVATGLVVADVVADRALLGAASTTSVEVLVPVVDLPDVLAALASEGDVTLVPAPAS